MHAVEIDQDTLIYQTNCLYTSEGQVVVCMRSEVGRVFFWDTARGIWGMVQPEWFDAELIHEEYLNNRYGYANATNELTNRVQAILDEHKHRVPCTR